MCVHSAVLGGFHGRRGRESREGRGERYKVKTEEGLDARLVGWEGGER